MHEDETLDLKDLDWHDLPVVSLAIRHDAVELVVTPYDEAISDYKTYQLTLYGFDGLSFDMQGTLTGRDLADLEVHSFDWTLEPDNRISGSIGILPANRGYWKVRFALARYTFTRIS